MKKFFAILLTALLVFSLAACGGNRNSSNDRDDETAKKPDPVETADPVDPLELLTTVWDSYGNDEKFPIAGGDLSEENMTMDAPGKFDVSDADALDVTLGFPAASADQIDDAASVVHMMNANTFTCGAFHLKDAGTSADVSAAIKDNIMHRQWLCGFPDKLVIVEVDDCLVAFFGANDLVDAFAAKLTAAYSGAKTVCDEPIA